MTLKQQRDHRRISGLLALHRKNLDELAALVQEDQPVLGRDALVRLKTVLGKFRVLYYGHSDALLAEDERMPNGRERHKYETVEAMSAKRDTSWQL